MSRRISICLLAFCLTYLTTAVTQHAAISQTALPDERLHIVLDEKQPFPGLQSLIEAARRVPGVIVDTKPVEGWLVRIRSNAGQLALEREDGIVFKTIPATPVDVENSLKIELRWRRLVNLRNLNADGTVKIEFRWVPVAVGKDSDGNFTVLRDLPLHEAKVGDFITLELRNIGKIGAYVTIFDLESDGAATLMWPDRNSEVKDRLFPADNSVEPEKRQWRKLTVTGGGSPAIFRLSSPDEHEVFKAIATTVPVDWSGLTRGPTAKHGPLEGILNADPPVRLPDRSQKKEAQWATATLAIRIPYPETLHILSVGASVSLDPAKHRKFAEVDAVAVAEDFTKSAGHVFDDVKTVILTGDNATKDKIEIAFTDLASRARPWDTVVIYYAGPTTISPLDIQFWTGRISAKRQLLILDAGYTQSDINAKIRRLKLDAGFTEAQIHMFVDAGIKDQRKILALADRQLTVIGVSGDQKEDAAAPFEHGLLAQALTDGITGTGGLPAGNITVFELTDFVTKKLNSQSRGKDVVISGHTDQDFVIGTIKGRDGEVTRSTVIANSISEDGSPIGADYAVCFGTDDYDDLDQLAPLKNPISDATSIADALQNRYGFKARTLKNQTFDNIWDKLAEYKRLCKPIDRLVIFFAGHGVYSQEYREGFLAAKDSRPEHIPGGNLLQYHNLRNLIDDLPCHKILIVIDACFAGEFDLDDWKDHAVVGQAYNIRKYLTSVRHQQALDGQPNHHSPFAAEMLAVLQEFANQSKPLHVDSLKTQIRDRTSQEPVLGDFGSGKVDGDFVLIPKAAAGG